MKTSIKLILLICGIFLLSGCITVHSNLDKCDGTKEITCYRYISGGFLGGVSEKEVGCDTPHDLYLTTYYRKTNSSSLIYCEYVHNLTYGVLDGE